MTNIVEGAAGVGNLTILLHALETTELQATLVGPEIFTLFAPTDEAFEGLSGSLMDDPDKFKRVIAYHVGFGDVRAEDLAEIDEVVTLEGSIIAVHAEGGQIQLNDANVVTSDVIVDNGVIHVIDRVLFPALVLSE